MITIEQLLADHQSGHSDLQIDRFIVEKGNWTPYGRYKQALREIAGRHNSLQEMREDAELAVLDLDDAKVELQRELSGTTGFARKQIAHNRQARKLEQIQRAITTQQRELDRLVALATDLKQQIGELTPERREELDRETWSVRIRAMVAMDLLMGGRPSPATAELLIALPADMRQPILEDAAQPGKLIGWLQRGPRAIPE